MQGALKISSLTGVGHQDQIDRVVNKATYVEWQLILIHARYQNGRTMRINVDTILLAIYLNSIPKFATQWQKAKDPLVTYDAIVLVAEVKYHSAVPISPLIIILIKIMVKNHLL